MLSLHTDVITVHLRDGIRKDVELTIVETKSEKPLWVSPVMISVMPSERGRMVWRRNSQKSAECHCAEQWSHNGSLSALCAVPKGNGYFFPNREQMLKAVLHLQVQKCFLSSNTSLP